jgi:cell division septum initiation protein DivIVA
MKKVILGLALIIVFAIAGGVYYVLTNLDSLIEAAIEKHGSEATGTAVLVDSVKIDLSNGAGGISGLTIANPQGFDLPYAFSLGEIRAGIDLESLKEEPYIIDEITILSPRVFVEINEDTRTNLNVLKKNLAAGSGSGSSTEAKGQSPSESSGNEPRLIIRRVTFAEGSIQAKVAALQNKEYQLKLPGLDMKDLGGTRGATGAELASEILKRLTDRASEVVQKEIIDAELNKLKQKAKAKVDEETARLKARADAKTEEEKQKAEDKLKDLFGR